jgi:hypothetical protein
VRVSNGIRRRDNTEPRAQGCKPFQLLTLLELGDHRGIVDDADESRIADVAGAYGVELCAAGPLFRSTPASSTPPVSQLAWAPPIAPSSLRDPARREQLRPTYRVAEGGVVFDNPRERLGHPPKPVSLHVAPILISTASASRLLFYACRA